MRSNDDRMVDHDADQYLSGSFAALVAHQDCDPERPGGEGDFSLVAAQELSTQGWTIVRGFLDESDCSWLRSEYDHDAIYRSTVNMRRHGFGEGQYRYFDYPLPKLVQQKREQLYRGLVPVANQWRLIRGREPFPAEHAEYLELCHAAGQTRPTPLILRYREGDYNRLHQDLYGEYVFPIQAVVMLSRPGEEYTGGELVLVEQKPRSQSRARVISLRQGDAAIFAVNEFPARGARGFYHLKLRHGVSEVLSGERLTLGLIFHDAL